MNFIYALVAVLCFLVASISQAASFEYVTSSRDGLVDIYTNSAVFLTNILKKGDENSHEGVVSENIMLFMPLEGEYFTVQARRPRMNSARQVSLVFEAYFGPEIKASSDQLIVSSPKAFIDWGIQSDPLALDGHDKVFIQLEAGAVASFTARIVGHVDGEYRWCISRGDAGECSWIDAKDPGHLFMSVGTIVSAIPEPDAFPLVLGGLGGVALFLCLRNRQNDLPPPCRTS